MTREECEAFEADLVRRCEEHELTYVEAQRLSDEAWAKEERWYERADRLMREIFQELGKQYCYIQDEPGPGAVVQAGVLTPLIVKYALETRTEFDWHVKLNGNTNKFDCTPRLREQETRRFSYQEEKC